MITIKVNGSRLNQLQARLGNMRPIMAGISNMMLEVVERNFSTQSNPETGLQWIPLTAHTMQKRAKQGYWPGKILQVSGSLASSISPNYGNDYAIISTNKIYAAIHHFGGNTGRGHAANIPARPYLALSKQDERDINDTVSDYLAQGLT